MKNEPKPKSWFDKLTFDKMVMVGLFIFLVISFVTEWRTQIKLDEATTTLDSCMMALNLPEPDASTLIMPETVDYTVPEVGTVVRQKNISDFFKSKDGGPALAFDYSQCDRVDCSCNTITCNLTCVSYRNNTDGGQNGWA